LGLLGVMLAISTLSACDQPAPHCNVAHGSFWGKYSLVSGEGACAMLTGEQLDVQSYYAQRSKTDKRPDYDAVSIAIQPKTITDAIGNAAGIADPEADDVAYAMGRFVTTKPEGDGFCRADKLEAARLHLPVVAEHPLDMCTSAAKAPAYNISYEFSRVRVYYTPAAIGTQFEADLTYTQDDCVAKYKVSALFPVVSCAATADSADAGAALAADGGDDASADAAAAAADAGTADAACPAPAPAAAGPEPTADAALCENAGINPDFAVSCDPVQMVCVLKKSAPSLK
jgi:hypothetical protein